MSDITDKLKKRHDIREKKHNFKFMRDLTKGRRKGIDYSDFRQKYTNYFMKADSNIKEGNYSKALDFLSKVYDHLNDHNRYMFPEVIKKQAAAIQRRAFRISNKTDDLELDDCARHLVGDLKELYGVHPHSALEKSIGLGALIVGLLGAMFFFSPNVTGNVIGNLTNSSSNNLGVLFFIFGLVGAYFLVRK